MHLFVARQREAKNRRQERKQVKLNGTRDLNIDLAARAATARALGLVRVVNTHASAQAQHQVESALLLNVVVGESAAILQLLTSEDEALLVRGDALLVLDLGLHGIDGVG